MKEEICTEVARHGSDVPQRRDDLAAKGGIAHLASLRYHDAEAELCSIIDSYTADPEYDPLEGLASIIRLMQSVNVELVKAMAPALVENARLKGDHFASKGELAKGNREDTRALNSFFKTQEAVVKLGIAQTRVEDEIRRRRSG